MQLAECAALNSVPGETCSWLTLRIALNRASLCLPAWVSQCNKLILRPHSAGTPCLRISGTPRKSYHWIARLAVCSDARWGVPCSPVLPGSQGGQPL